MRMVAHADAIGCYRENNSLSSLLGVIAMAGYYKHSGKFGPQGPILGLLGGIVFSVPAAILYDFGLFTVREMKLRFVCTLVFGLLLGAVCGAMMCLGKVRSSLLAGIVGFAVSFTGLYVSWTAWLAGTLHALYPSYRIPGVLQPIQVWKAVLAVNPHGTWSSGGGAATHGVTLWFVWAAEALVILGFGVLLAVGFVRRRPFCERCEQWCKRECKLYFAPSLSPNDLKTQLESGDIRKLEKLAPGNKKQPHYRIHLNSCGVCHQLNTLTLEQIFPRNYRTLINKLLLTGEQAGVLRNIEMNQRAAAGANAVPASAK